MNKIKKISYIFRVIFQIIFVILPCLLILFWINAPNPIGSQSGFPISFIHGIPILHVLSPETKIYGFLISLIPESIKLLVLYFLIKLFKLYERGEIFSLENVNYIRKIGYILLIGQALNPVYHGLMTLAMTWNNPQGFRYASISLTTTNLAVLATAFLIILISWIMTEGHKLREEQTYII